MNHDHVVSSGVHSRRFRLIVIGAAIVMAVTCYFCWEILYQERVILNILRMTKNTETDRLKVALNSDHLEEVVEAWFEQKKHEVIKKLRSGDNADSNNIRKHLTLTKQELEDQVQQKLEAERVG